MVTKNLISSCPGVNWNGDQEILGSDGNVLYPVTSEFIKYSFQIRMCFVIDKLCYNKRYLSQ